MCETQVPAQPHVCCCMMSDEVLCHTCFDAELRHTRNAHTHTHVHKHTKCRSLIRHHSYKLHCTHLQHAGDFFSALDHKLHEVFDVHTLVRVLLHLQLCVGVLRQQVTDVLVVDLQVAGTYEVLLGACSGEKGICEYMLCVCVCV